MKKLFEILTSEKIESVRCGEGWRIGNLEKSERTKIVKAIIEQFNNQYETDAGDEGWNIILHSKLNNRQLFVFTHSDIDNKESLIAESYMIYDDENFFDTLEECLMVETKLINLTPHDINLLDENYNQIQEIPSAGLPPVRATEKKEISNTINGVPVYKTTFGDVQNLPEEKNNTIYIVSRIIIDACPQRTDLVTTSSIVRKDAKGKLSSHPFAKGDIVGCQAFAN